MQKENRFLEILKQAQKQKPELEELIHPEKLQEIPIAKLVRPSYSRRELIPNLQKTIVKSLYEHGFVGGIVVTKIFNVIDGWHRSEVWKMMGYKTIPCYILDVDYVTEQKLHLALNRHIAQFNPSDFGFTEAFSSINLVEDFGFTKADILNKPPEAPATKNVNRYQSRLITSIPVQYHEKLNLIKKSMQVQNKSQVLIKLIDFYENYNYDIQKIG